MKETGRRRGWESPVRPPLFSGSITFFILSCLGEKRGVPFHAKQGVAQEGPSGAFSSSYSHLFLFFPPSPSLCLFNWTDWPHRSHLQSWGHVGIPGNQYCGKVKGKSFRRKCSKFQLANGEMINKLDFFWVLRFALVSTSTMQLLECILTLTSRQLDQSHEKGVRETRMPESGADLLCDWCRHNV